MLYRLFVGVYINEMPSIEELEDKIHEEEIKARYNSLNTKELDELDKAHKWYVDYTKKDYHPISHQLEIESRSAPQYGITDKLVVDTLNMAYLLSIGVMLFSLSIGFAFTILLLSALFSGY